MKYPMWIVPNLLLPSKGELELLSSLGVDLIATQRKGYDEYYVDTSPILVELSLPELMRISQEFRVILEDQMVVIGDGL